MDNAEAKRLARLHFDYANGYATTTRPVEERYVELANAVQEAVMLDDTEKEDNSIELAECEGRLEEEEERVTAYENAMHSVGAALQELKGKLVALLQKGKPDEGNPPEVDDALELLDAAINEVKEAAFI